MNWIKKHLLRIIFLVVGALAGLAYWYFIGCTSGSCPIKSVWHMSTLFGGIIGYLLGGIIEDFRGKGK